MSGGERLLPEDQRAAKLRSILAGLESLGSRPVNARNQRQRLGELRAGITNLAHKEAKNLCCCQLITVANEPEEFDAEMKRSCLIHGRRNLGHLVVVTCTPPDQDDVRLLELVLKYRQG